MRVKVGDAYVFVTHGGWGSYVSGYQVKRVSNIYKNGNIVFEKGGQQYRSHGDWLSSTSRSYYGPQVYLATAEKMEELRADMVETRAMRVRNWLTDQMARKDLTLSPDQLARIVAILNEEQSND